MTLVCSLQLFLISSLIFPCQHTSPHSLPFKISSVWWKPVWGGLALKLLKDKIQYFCTTLCWFKNMVSEICELFSFPEYNVWSCSLEFIVFKVQVESWPVSITEVERAVCVYRPQFANLCLEPCKFKCLVCKHSMMKRVLTQSVGQGLCAYI